MQCGRCSEHRQSLVEEDSQWERVLKGLLRANKHEREELCIWLDTVSTRAKEDSQNSEAGVVEMGRLCER